MHFISGKAFPTIISQYDSLHRQGRELFSGLIDEFYNNIWEYDHRVDLYGRSLMEHWESDMKARGYDLVMTSTQTDEEAQHFYRALGYQDCGSLILPFPGYEQPAELIMAKQI